MEPRDAKLKSTEFKTSLPVFNKRLFKANAGIVITEDALKVLQKSPELARTPREQHSIKPVINGLREIHKGLQYIKEALTRVLTYEKYETNALLSKEDDETTVPCLYILYGSVEAVYRVTNTSASGRNSSTSISYTHLAGEYLGLVSSDGEQFDLPSPDSIRTMEVSEFLRINREKFHSTVKQVQSLYIQEIQNYILMSRLFASFSGDEKNKIVHQMAKQEYPPGHVIVNQDEMPDHVFFVTEGRCQYFRQVYIPEARRSEIVKLGQADQGDFFGECSVLDGVTSFCSVASIGPVTCYLINKWAIKHNEGFLNMLRKNRPHFCLDHEIKYHIRDSDLWQSYKRETVTNFLETSGKESLVINRERVPSALLRSIDYGDTSRHYSRTSFNRDEIFPGAPRTNNPLFYIPRRRESSAHSVPKLHYPGNTAAVVKAVLLLSNTREKSDVSKRRMSGILLKPMTAPERRRHYSGNSKDERPRTMPASTNERTLFSRGKTQKKELSRTSTPKVPKVRVNKKPVKTKVKKTGLKSKKDEPEVLKVKPEKKIPAYAVAEQSTAPRRNYIEIINTGLPGKRPLTSYQRFEPSMFGVLDTLDEFDLSTKKQREAEELERMNQLKATWTVSLSAKKWQRKTQRVNTRPDSPQVEHPSPIIVVEDWSEHESEGSRGGFISPPFGDPQRLRRLSRSVTPNLEDVLEESDDELRKIEEEEKEREQLPDVTWTTEIHQARKESELKIKTLKKDLEELKEQLEKAHIDVTNKDNTNIESSQSGGRLESATQARRKLDKKISFKQVVEKYLKSNRRNILLHAAVSAFQQSPAHDRSTANRYNWKKDYHVRFPTPPPGSPYPRSSFSQSRRRSSASQTPPCRPRAKSDCTQEATSARSLNKERKISSATQFLLSRIDQAEKVTAVSVASG